MTKLLSCRYNMDTNRVEARFEDGTTLAIDCIAVEDEYGNTPAQRFKLLGESNLTLSGSDKPTYDKNDFSINNIAPSEIAKCALTLLSQKHKEIVC